VPIAAIERLYARETEIAEQEKNAGDSGIYSLATFCLEAALTVATSKAKSGLLDRKFKVRNRV
jgi:hypothetical protein